MIKTALQTTLKSSSGDMMLKVEIDIQPKSFVTLYGKSGVGKTTILRMLAGLMTPEKGRITVFDETWLDTDQNICMPTQKRRVGMVFQDYALFPNMTVLENLRYAMDTKDGSEVIEELIDMMELGDLRSRKPETLSGGQKQRVAVARALVRRPTILLLDEPLSAIDHELRGKLQDFILQAHKSFGTTTILVSHDISEIFKMSDQIIEIDEGRIKRSGSASSLFSPKTVSGKFQFIGEVLQIVKEDVVYVVTVLIGKDTVKVVAEENEVADISVGDKVLVASKAFNPIIRKI